MEYYDNVLCVSGAEVIISDKNPKGIITAELWKKWKRDGAVVKRRACYGQSSLIEFNTIPARYRDLIAERFGTPAEQAVIKPFIDRVIADSKAITFFSSYIKADGENLEGKYIKEYSANTAVLNAIHEVYSNATISRKQLGGTLKKFWDKASVAVNSVRVQQGHTLPAKATPLKRKYQLYIDKGYEALISGKFCNDNSRKVSVEIERLMMSLYAMPNKPFSADVHSLYLDFIAGKIQVADRKTGELFSPSQFIHNGKALELGRTTVWSYLNQPNNRMIVDKIRSGTHRYNSTSRPHHHRHAPEYSFSKITMDDRDLPRKCVNGKWVKAYYAYDVASGCVIGYSYSLNKDEALFLACMRDMFRLIEREGFGMPLEVEVENHLVNKFFDELGAMFPFVRICNPGNSQEKHAEHLNRAKKYGIEKKTQNGIGRWWSKHEAYTTDRDKVNDEFVEKQYTYERLVADDIQACRDFNNQLHPKQKKYPGKTRWEVLVENMNPQASQVSKPVVYKGIGERTLTTINRNQYVTVQHQKYQLPKVEIMDRLLPNNYSVEAYYLPDADGLITEVFLYQQGTYLCKADKIVAYNTSKAEWTQKDKDGFIHQSSYVSQFDSHTKKGKNDLHTPIIVESTIVRQALDQSLAQEVVSLEPDYPPLDEFNADEYAQNAIENL